MTMPDKDYRAIEKLMASRQPEEVRRGLALAREEVSKIGPDEAGPILEIVSTIFYIDPLDRPDLVPVLDEAISLVAGFGKKVIPVLLQCLEAGDVKAQLAFGQALGRMGEEAIGPLMAGYEHACDAACRAFILYALGHVRSPEVVRAAPLAIRAAQASDQELRDTATRAIGKFAEVIPPERLPAELRDGFVEQLQLALADPNPAIRSKAVRSYGKLARHGHLTADEREQLRTTLLHILGEDEHFDWDRAYVVRREAREALEFFKDAA